MTIYIKTSKDIKKMKIAGKLAAKVLEMIKPYIKPGITTEKINHICHNYIINVQKAISATLGYKGFPKSICTSVNEVVCHGIPCSTQKLKNGDIINIDVTIIKDGYYGDTSKMFFVGKPSYLSKLLCVITQKSLYLAIKMIKPGIRLNEIGKTIQKFIEKKNFSIVKEYCGHGIGFKFHEEPQILHYNTHDNGVIIEPGMTFTIEPMINIGKCHVYTCEDGWTVKTKDKSLSAQYEHTVAVTNKGCEVLTKRKNEHIF